MRAMKSPQHASPSTSPSPPGSSVPLWSGRGLILAGIVLSAFNLRTAVTSLTPLLDQLGHLFGFGATMTGVFGMLPTAAFALFGVLTPGIAHRIGLERTALLAMALAAVGLLLRSLAGGSGALLAASAVALAGMGIGNIVLPPLVKRYFADRVGTVSTLYITVLQAGTILPALLAVPVMAASNWQISLGLWSLFAVAAALPWIGVLWIERRHDTPMAQMHDQAVTGGDEAPELSAPAARGRVWRSPVAWGMALMFGMTSLVTYSMFTWLPKLLIEAGGSEALGGTMVGLFSALGLVASLTMPALAVRMRNPYTVVLACAAFYAVAFSGCCGTDGRAGPVGGAAGHGTQYLPAGADDDQPAHAHAGRIRVAVWLHAGRGLFAVLPGTADVRPAARAYPRLVVAVRFPGAMHWRAAGGWLPGLQAAVPGGYVVRGRDWGIGIRDSGLVEA